VSRIGRKTNLDVIPPTETFAELSGDILIETVGPAIAAEGIITSVALAMAFHRTGIVVAPSANDVAGIVTGDDSPIIKFASAIGCLALKTLGRSTKSTVLAVICVVIDYLKDHLKIDQAVVDFFRDGRGSIFEELQDFHIGPGMRLGDSGFLGNGGDAGIRKGKGKNKGGEDFHHDGNGS